MHRQLSSPNELLTEGKPVLQNNVVLQKFAEIEIRRQTAVLEVCTLNILSDRLFDGSIESLLEDSEKDI